VKEIVESRKRKKSPVKLWRRKKRSTERWLVCMGLR